MKKILITGVGGFIGRNAARHFSQEGHHVYGIDAIPEESTPLHDLHAYYRLRLPSEQLDTVINEISPDACIHCAGRASVALSVSDPLADFEAGPALTWRLLNTLRLRAPACRTVFLSSAAIYGTPSVLPISESTRPAPISPYGYHKWISEMVCEEFASLYEMPIASVRIFSAYGPGLRRQVIWDLFRQAFTQNSISAQGTGNESRDFVHVVDICEALSIVLEQGQLKGEAYNLGSGVETSIAKLTSLVSSSTNKEIKISFSGHVPAGTPLNWRADMAQLSNLGFRPSITIEDGIHSFAKWCSAELGIQ
ncbi:MAG TPA: dTDP-glucose 4,6-dehydratase [Planctomycetaceae bacterium]|nr:dTDP-glucose 4,6-dehydratase [Planctomycetaceae bacterium]